MPKSMTAIQARLKVKGEEKKTLDDLMRKWSSCKRLAYKRLLVGRVKNELKRELQNKFGLNSRYVDDAVLEAQSIINLSKELGGKPEKVIFGGRDLFKKLSKNRLSDKQKKMLKREWKERRQCNAYSRGDRRKNGNLNLRIVKEGKKHYLRVNVGNRNLISYGEIPTPHLFDGRKVKRDCWAWQYAHQLARRYSVAVKEVNPVYTSVIGMLKYAPQLSLTKDIASAWVIARRGLGLSEGVPKSYRVFLQVAENSQRESGTVPESTDGRNSSTAENLRRSPYNLWRVLGVTGCGWRPKGRGLTALSPEGQKASGCLSPLKLLLISRDLGGTLKGRETLLPGTGSMGVQKPPAGHMGTLKRRGINSPAPELCSSAQFG